MEAPAPSYKRVRSFFDAIRPGNADTIRRRLSLGMPVDVTQGDDGYTALHVAALRGADDVAEALLERGADPNRLTAKGSCPLESAAYSGNAALMKRLIEAGASVHATGAGLALAAAIRRRHFDAALVLIAAGADPNASEDMMGSVLAQAIKAGASPDLVAALIRAGADVNGVGFYRPLAAAIGEERLDLLELLLEAGADVNGVNEYKDTALMHAAGLGKIQGVLRLLDRGATVDAREQRVGMTALMDAAQSGHTEVVDLLIARGADPELVDNDGKSAAAYGLEGHRVREEALAKKSAEEAALTASGVVLRPGKVVAGAFANFSGAAYAEENGKLKVRVEIFGRTTEIVLDASQFAFDP